MDESFASFGIIDSIGNKDRVLTLENYSNITISSKGLITDILSRKQIRQVVQNIATPTSFTIYFSNERQPIHLQTVNAKVCKELCYYLNDFIQSKPVRFSDTDFSLKLETIAEKKGKHAWAERFLRLYTRGLFIFRSPIIKDKKQHPLNVLDYSRMLVERIDSRILKIVTHREYEIRFSDSETADAWYREIILHLQENNSNEDNLNENSNTPILIKESEPQHIPGPPIISATYLQQKLHEMQERRKQRQSHEEECIPPPIPPPPPKHHHKQTEQ